MKPLVVFGKAADDLTSLQAAYPNLHFFSLKQIHSDIVVPSSDVANGPVDGDALWTAQSGEALCIRTADCVPVLFYSAKPELVAAAHAGWRGLESNIIGKTISVLKDQGAEPSQLQVWIGPHIRVDSFEVGIDVANKLDDVYSRLPSQGPLVVAHPDPAKRYVNLERLAVAQLVAAGVPLAQIYFDAADTLRSPEYHSFRRDGAQAGRQYSFIARG